MLPKIVRRETAFVTAMKDLRHCMTTGWQLFTRKFGSDGLLGCPIGDVHVHVTCICHMTKRPDDPFDHLVPSKYI